MSNKSASSIQKQVSALTGKPKNQLLKSFEEYDETIQRLWNMYQQQLQQNIKLMAYINDHQQQFAEQSLNTLPVAPPTSSAVQTIPSHTAVQPLSFENLREYTTYFCSLFNNPFRRIDGLHNLLHVLYTLYLLDGKAPAEQLFRQARLAEVTGFRIVGKLKLLNLVTSSGSKFNSYYTLTPMGRNFINKTLTVEEVRNHDIRICAKPFAAVTLNQAPNI